MTDNHSGTASRLVVGLAGASLAPAERAWVARWRPAGVILFGRNVISEIQLQTLCRDLHAILPGLEIVADHEGGPVSVLAAAVGRPPAAATLGLLDDPDLTYRVHAETARAAASCGIDRLLAPVADVMTHGRNPVIGVRAYGADPVLVSRHVAAAVRGLLAGGLRCCVKHWPGHGGTGEDSHLGAAHAGERPPGGPFVAAVGAGADAVMVAHVTAPGTGEVPATLATARDRELQRLTRQDRRVTLWADDLTMGALRRPLAARGVSAPAGEGMLDPGAVPADWIAAVAAGGCDRLLVRGIPWQAFPLPGAEGPTPGVPRPAATPAPSATGAASAETQMRLAALLPSALAAARALSWIDRTDGDRWGPVTGVQHRGDPRREVVGPGGRLLSRDDVGKADGILVTSHRPLDHEREARWAQRVGPQGLALGIGHPALAADLRSLLPAGWRVAWLPEWPGRPGRRADQKI